MMHPEAYLVSNGSLWIRKFTLDDCNFVLNLVNDPDWLKYIGDRQVDDLSQARLFIENGPFKSYQDNGFGLYVFGVDNRPAGMVGLLQRDYLEYPDLGYAILPLFRGKGLTNLACQALLKYEYERVGLQKIMAMVSPDNQASVNVLIRLGFTELQTIENEGVVSRLFEFKCTELAR